MSENFKYLWLGFALIAADESTAAEFTVIASRRSTHSLILSATGY
jgi:hypothetical protein